MPQSASRFEKIAQGSLRLPAARLAAKAAWRSHLLMRTSRSEVADDARRYAAFFAHQGYHDDAAWVLSQAARQVGGSASAALFAGAATAKLDGGRVPADLGAIVGRALAYADELLAEQEYDRCTDAVTEALTVHFHPTQHLGLNHSPLLSDPAAFAAPWMGDAEQGKPAHQVMETLLADPEPSVREPVDAQNVLVLGYENLTFTAPLVAEYRARGFQVREVDLAQLGEDVSLQALVAARLQYGLSGQRLPIPEAARDALEWADVVLVEWGHRALVWASLLEGLAAPLIARLDKYEMFTPMPLLAVWSSVARIAVPSEIIDDVLESSVPGFAAAQQARAVLPPRMMVEHFGRPKLSEASRTIAVVGWNKVAKDPAWALSVLRKVRSVDPTWRMLLIGSEEVAESGASEYYEDVTRSIVSLKDAVEVTGFTGDLPAMLRRVGVIISASQIEGTHEALVQGVASGALPVVRDWPQLRPWGGPARLFPQSWVVEDVDSAAERILKYAAPHESEEAHEAQQWVLDSLDWRVVQPHFDAAMLRARR